MKQSGSDVYVFELVFVHMEGISHRYFKYVMFAHTGHHVCMVAVVDVLCFGVTSPIITDAGVDGF